MLLKPIYLLVLLALLSRNVCFGQNDDSRIPSGIKFPVDTAADVSAKASAGQSLFQQKCGFCHGPDGSGGEGPDLLHSSLVLHDEKGNLITPVVRGSRQEKGMPAFQLSDQQIKDIAAFLHVEIKSDATIFYTDSTSSYPLSRLLIGNADAGKRFFEGKGKCSSCHSLSGDLAHIASKYKPVDLQNQLVYPTGAVPTVSVTLADGRKFAGQQVYADRFLVSLRAADGRVHTWRRDRVKVDIHDPLTAHETLLPTYTDEEIHDLFAYLETFK